ncbi:MAG: FAD-dependent oxidoreductase [Alphaproteobacteria bacterium]|nr:FAD-dependent oxidoreductase [Alphaproteobacteria bacterium]
MFDAIVVGGGIQGLLIALEASRAGHRVLLLERGRLGGETSANWYRILHGGLRYLQSLDLARMRSSAQDRQWFLSNYRAHVEPQGFLMPLYGRGLKRGSVFRAAFMVTKLITQSGGATTGGDCRLRDGRLLSRGETIEMFPGVRQESLTGGALWHDAVVTDTARLFEKLADDARGLGAKIIENMEATELVVENGKVAGISARDTPTGVLCDFAAPRVIVACGQENARLAEKFDRSRAQLFHPVLAFNVLLERPAPARCGISVSPPGKSGPMLFLYPDGGRTFAGTWYVPGKGNAATPDDVVPPEAIDAFLCALNDSVPDLGARPEHVVEVTSGLLPARSSQGTDLVHNEIIYDHGASGGPEGLVTVTATKFTTAPSVARKVIKHCGLGADLG